MSYALPGQQIYSLSDIIALAQSEAPDALLAETRLNNAYWRYQSFLSNYRPQINFNFDTDLRRAVDVVDQPNGKPLFVSRAFVNNAANISIQQDWAATGGTLIANTNLNRIDGFKSENIAPYTSYLFAPISLEYRQPLFAFNALKWNQRVAPVQYKESQQAYTEQMERIAYEAAQQYFNLLSAQLNLEAALRELALSDTLYSLSQGRFSVGRIAETDLLQMELRAMTASANVAEAQLTVETANESLRNFLGITQAITFSLEPPTRLPAIVGNVDSVLAHALQNRSLAIGFQRRLIESDLEVARAQRRAGPGVDLYGRFGLQANGDELNAATQSFQDAQVLSLGMRLPIADWGKNRAQLEIARSQRDLERMNVEQERNNVEQEIRLKFKQINLVKNQVTLAERVYEVSQKRYQITEKRYLIGKIGVLELNQAINDQESARRSYVQALRDYWISYYELRSLTLYDFENTTPIWMDLPEFD